MDVLFKRITASFFNESRSIFSINCGSISFKRMQPLLFEEKRKSYYIEKFCKASYLESNVYIQYLFQNMFRLLLCKTLLILDYVTTV